LPTNETVKVRERGWKLTSKIRIFPAALRALHTAEELNIGNSSKKSCGAKPRVHTMMMMINYHHSISVLLFTSNIGRRIISAAKFGTVAFNLGTHADHLLDGTNQSLSRVCIPLRQSSWLFQHFH